MDSFMGLGKAATDWRAVVAAIACIVLMQASGCARHKNDVAGGSKSPFVALDGSAASKESSGTGARLVSAINDSTTRLTSATKSLTNQITPQPSHQRVWRPELTVLPIIDSDGWKIDIHNVRNCRYRTAEDYDVRFYDLSFQLTDLQSIDFIVVPFQSADFLAHTMLSFGLQDGRHFLVSVEARLEKNEVYSTVGGLRDQFELMYIVGDERDLIPLRTRVRAVDCYLYPGKATPEDVQRLFLDIIERVNKIAKSPEFYNTLSNNCTTNLVNHVNDVFPDRIPIWDWRVLLPGRSDRLAYELGLLDLPNENFEAIRHLYRINTQATLYENDPQFSQRIRVRPAN